MADYRNKIASSLIESATVLLDQPREAVYFTDNPEANSMLNNLEKYPHMFVLAC